VIPQAQAGEADVAARAARAGAAAALASFGQALGVVDKGSGADPVSDADRDAEAAAVALIRAERPADGLLGEEGAAAEAPGGRRWVVDGIDGTQNFLARVPHWCCAVGLEDGGAAVAGAVCDPLRDELFAGAAGAGCTLNGVPVRPRADGRLVATFVHPRRVWGADQVAAVVFGLAEAGLSPRVTGCGGIELAWVAAGRLAGWVQPDADPWDWTPGRALVEAAGGHCLVEGAWHVAAATPALADELLTALGAR
jgi:fructose-1,6-bisphosphatase/inositol monophosphatase family enzyme